MSHRLTNRDIRSKYKYNNSEFWLMQSDFMGAFAYWVTVQSPYDVPPWPEYIEAVEAFHAYITFYLPDNDLPVRFTYVQLEEIINAAAFEEISAIKKLNQPRVSEGPGYENRHNEPHPDYEFIDLNTLARNVFYMILREDITQR